MSNEVKPLMDQKEVLATVKVSRATLWKMLKAGDFPQPIRIGSALRWRPETVQAWIVSRSEAA